MDERAAALHAWLNETLIKTNGNPAEGVFTPVSGDASFRRYFRLRWRDRSVIGVDAPPEKENCEPFVRIGAAMLAHGVRVPAVLARDVEKGFMMLEDFGDTLLRPLLTAQSVNDYYALALEDLLHIQQCAFDPQLPCYDAALLLREMALFRDWFVLQYLGLVLDADEEVLITRALEYLKDVALQQPQVTVHRDFHSRNIMVMADGRLGHIDFQDAVHGPVTYDLVSLLRDCYVDWPVQQVYGWVDGFAARLRAEGRLAVNDAVFRHWFDTMGAQRHIKVLGIFARLFLRDGKSGYLGDLPRTLAYLLHATSVTSELHGFDQWLRARIVPALLEKDPQAARYIGDTALPLGAGAQSAGENS